MNSRTRAPRSRSHPDPEREYPGYQRPAPATFLDDDDQADQLRRCLTDASLPLDIRIADALVRLYGLPITRIVYLTATNQFHEDDTGAYFTFD
ncbi:hypothetical protein N7U49_48020 (plasmid) [Streptomyces sp. AD2-2]|nr:hypothetical protein N7U49_48020 [Streptomyces sp. AD2-2]